MLNEQVYPSTANWQVADGMTVYSIDGEKLGTVRNYDPQADYLDVQMGWLFRRDFYVPLPAVTAVEDDSVTLNLTKDELDDERYSAPQVPGAAPAEPVTLADGSVVGTGAMRQRSWDDGDTP
jgi:hypothetical protein